MVFKGRLDKSERIRFFFNTQIAKMKRIASVTSMVLLALNLSFTIYPFVEHRFPEIILGIPRTWVVIPILIIIIILIIWLFAHIYMNILEMYRTEIQADNLYNPFSIYAITPFEEMLFRVMTIPTLEACFLSMPDCKEKEEVKKNLDMAKRWVELGYIPKEDFPEHLKPMYLTDKENRLNRL